MTAPTVLHIGARGRFDRFFPRFLGKTPELGVTYSGREAFARFVEGARESSILGMMEREHGARAQALQILSNPHFLAEPSGIINEGCFYLIHDWKLRRLAGVLERVDAMVVLEICDIFDMMDRVPNEVFRARATKMISEQPERLNWVDVVEELLAAIPPERLVILNGSRIRSAGPLMLADLIRRRGLEVPKIDALSTTKQLAARQDEERRVAKIRSAMCKSHGIHHSYGYRMSELFDEQLDELSGLPLRCFL